jgi:K+ transporter
VDFRPIKPKTVSYIEIIYYSSCKKGTVALESTNVFLVYESLCIVVVFNKMQKLTTYSLPYLKLQHICDNFYCTEVILIGTQLLV